MTDEDIKKLRGVIREEVTSVVNQEVTLIVKREVALTVKTTVTPIIQKEVRASEERLTARIRQLSVDIGDYIERIEEKLDKATNKNSEQDIRLDRIESVVGIV